VGDIVAYATTSAKSPSRPPHSTSKEAIDPMTWKLDTSHSALVVSARHMMITTVRGTLQVADATIDFDPEHPERSSVEARIDAASIDTGVEQRDAHLRSPDFLNAEQHPYITFRSTRIEPKGEAYLIHGDLTIRGVTRPVTLDAEIAGVVADWQGGDRAAFSARTKIDREAWGLNWNVALEAGGWLVGKEFGVEIELAALRAAAAGESRQRSAA
jgi:polyisoprenoid-binding protein YceI